jgi:hypothetical protein
MKTYIITVKSIGYDTIVLRVNASNLTFAKSYKTEAIQKFAEVNDICFADAKMLGSISILKN